MLRMGKMQDGQVARCPGRSGQKLVKTQDAEEKIAEIAR
jgi:hypothetical protein